MGAIRQAFKDLYEKLGVPGVAWIHDNTQTIHGHGLFPNSDGRRTLDLSPTFLREVQGFQWTKALISGRGRGRRKALSVYWLLKNLGQPNADMKSPESLAIGSKALENLRELF